MIYLRSTIKLGDVYWYDPHYVKVFIIALTSVEKSK